MDRDQGQSHGASWALVGLVSSGAGRDDKVLKPPSNDHSNGERCRQTVAGLTRSQVAWVNRSIQGGYYDHQTILTECFQSPH